MPTKLEPSIKYFGVMIDAKLSFKQHVHYACDKESTARLALENNAERGRATVYLQATYCQGAELDLALCQPYLGKGIPHII